MVQRSMSQFHQRGPLFHRDDDIKACHLCLRPTKDSYNLNEVLARILNLQISECSPTSLQIIQNFRSSEVKELPSLQSL